MKLFSALYDKVMGWSAHRHAPYYLMANSFAESVFWPIPPDVMLAPMALARPAKAWHFALIASLASTLGGLAGYLLGYWLFDLAVQPMIQAFGYQDNFELIQQWFARWDFWIVFLAGFSPIPYKLFTVTAGMLHMALLPFMLASVISRSARFFLVAALMKWGGARMEQKLRQYIDLIGWLTVALAVIVYLIFRH
ncbi:MAG: DedA family protein [Aeromonadaceae bacterium]|nr:DedA family protein [Aeromonadaceae bacterium]